MSKCFFLPFAGIALYPGKARLISCEHHYHGHIPSRLLAGQMEDSDCVIQHVIYNDPYTNRSKVSFPPFYTRLDSDSRLCNVFFFTLSRVWTSARYSGTGRRLVLKQTKSLLMALFF